MDSDGRHIRMDHDMTEFDWLAAEARLELSIPGPVRHAADRLAVCRDRCQEIYLCSARDVVIGTLRFWQDVEGANGLIAAANHEIGWEFIDPEHPHEVGVWSMESGNVSHRDRSLLDFRKEYIKAAEWPVFDRESPPTGHFGLARTDTYYEAILDPITTDDWDRAVAEEVAIEPEPFRHFLTGEILEVKNFRKASFGNATIVYGGSAAQAPDVPGIREVLDRLGETLGATVFAPSEREDGL